MLTATDRTAPSPVQPHTGTVTLINSFEVPAGREDTFVAMWQTMAAWFRSQPGYISNRLHCAVSPNAPYRFVNVVQWRSEADYQSAHRSPEFLRQVQAQAWQEFPNRPALYEVVVDANAEAGITFDATSSGSSAYGARQACNARPRTDTDNNCRDRDAQQSRSVSRR
jgi:heme-degrading monooxygenase HmoA